MNGRALLARITAGLCLLPALAQAGEPCRVRVIDDENGWPVPLVELKTTHQVSFFTDNAGQVAFDLPELMGVETWLEVAADGYEVKQDGFGFRGVRVTPRPGGEVEIPVRRTIVAQRLGRITGGGIFAESQKLGDHLDWKESGILGSDSVQNAVHGGRMFWAWGDTVLARYPLGLFHMTSAVTAVQPLARFEPPLELPLLYFRDGEGQVRHVANVHPSDPGPTWIGGYVSLPDAAGKALLVGHYAKIKPPLESYRTGLCVWNEETSGFESVRVLWEQSSGLPEPERAPSGHPAFWKDEAGRDWVLFGNPLPTMKIPASFEAWQDPGAWEALDPVKTLPDAEGKPVRLHSGSMAWNPFRGRWVIVFVELHGSPSALGEVWYAESKSPLGPWGTAVKVLSHRQHSFYNPRLHPEFPPEDSPVLLFEGTYTHTFSRAKAMTPRHDYNQVMYRLDLDDPRLEAAQVP